MMPGDYSRIFEGPEDGEVPTWADDPHPAWMPRLSADEIMRLKNEIIDFIQDHDPFGDRISQHKLRCLSKYFADAAASAALTAIQGKCDD